MKRCYNKCKFFRELEDNRMNGIVALWKEKGMTSHDCVMKLRRLFKTKKVGHTGTLDPNVEGVLPICIGSATKMVEFMLNSGKEYVGEITLGYTTTTEDSDGEKVEEMSIDVIPTPEQVDAAMARMTGALKQIPPMYSAVKVNGKKLYEYARANIPVERPVRDVVIDQFERTSDIVRHADGTVSWSFSVKCSKGTYVRTLAVDLGKSLGFPAHMSRLLRTKSAGFVTEQCVRLSDLEAMLEDKRQDVLIPIEQAFLDYDKYVIDEALFAQVKNGAVLTEIEGVQYPVFFEFNKKLVALYMQHPTKKGYIKPQKMLKNTEEIV